MSDTYWTCFGRLWGHCSSKHATREEAERHAWTLYKALKRFDPQQTDAIRAHRSDCPVLATRGAECACAALAKND